VSEFTLIISMNFELILSHYCHAYIFKI